VCRRFSEPPTAPRLWTSPEGDPEIPVHDARWRLETIAESIGLSGTELAELILYQHRDFAEVLPGVESLPVGAPVDPQAG
jgi:hypothetical protein